MLTTIAPGCARRMVIGTRTRPEADRRTQREPSRRSEIAGSTTAGAVGGARGGARAAAGGAEAGGSSTALTPIVTVAGSDSRPPSLGAVAERVAAGRRQVIGGRRAVGPGGRRVDVRVVRAGRRHGGEVRLRVDLIRGSWIADHDDRLSVGEAEPAVERGAVPLGVEVEREEHRVAGVQLERVEVPVVAPGPRSREALPLGASRARPVVVRLGLRGRRTGVDVEPEVVGPDRRGPVKPGRRGSTCRRPGSWRPRCSTSSR